MEKLIKSQREITMVDKYMSDDLFTEFLESVHEGGKILRGEKEPSRSTNIPTPSPQHNPQTQESKSASSASQQENK